MDKVLSAFEAISTIQSGMTIGIGGWGSRRKPMSLIRELIKTDKTDFTLVSYGGPDVGMLCAAEKVKKLIFGFVTLETSPLEPHFRKARQEGKIDIMEIDEGMMNLGLTAALFIKILIAIFLFNKSKLTSIMDFSEVTSIR